MTQPASLDERYAALAARVPLTDTHNDFPYLLRSQLHYEIATTPGFNFDSLLTCHTDLVKMREARMGLQFFSCWIECKTEDYLSQDFNQASTVVRDTLEQIDVVRRLVDLHSEALTFVTTAKQALENFTSSGGNKISITLGVEGLHQADLSLGVVRAYHALGVRYITLTHNCDNPFATAASSVAGGLPDRGLTPFGRDCVAEMNRLGMMVDLSHVSYQTMMDVLDTTKAPLLFSHSSVYALSPHLRNVQDAVLERVKANGGVVCINFFPIFLARQGQDPAQVTIEDAVDHVAYVIDRIGWDHVGFGSDFDGISSGPKGLEDVSKYPALVKALWARTNATDAQIAKVMGLNVLRVWSQCEEVAQQLAAQLPVESNWEGRQWVFHDYVNTYFPELFPGSKGCKPGNVYTDHDLVVKEKAKDDPQVSTEPKAN